MKIGYSVEGSTDRAFLTGLRQRWCPVAELVPGHFPGDTGQSLRRELRQICEELAIKSVHVMMFLVDADEREWRDVKRQMSQLLPEARRELVILGVAERNVECWICADPNYIATMLRVPQEELRVPEPKGRFESAMRISGADRKEPEIAALVENAPLHKWLANASFEDFYEQIRDVSQRLRCDMENLRDAAAR